MPRTFCLSAAALFGLGLFAAVAEAAPEIEVRLGFGGYCLGGGWTLVRAEVSLPADAEAVSGQVRVFGDWRRRPAAYGTPIQLAPGTRKRVEFAIPALNTNPSSPAAASLPTVQLIDDSGQVLASVMAENPATALNSATHPLVLSVSSSGRGLNDLHNDDPNKKGPRVAALRVAELPTFWWAYDGVAMIVLSDLVERPEPAQLAAIEAYVAQGGVLVFVASGRPFWKAEEYRELLPIRPSEEALEPDGAARKALGIGSEEPLTIADVRRGRELGVELRPILSRTPLSASWRWGEGAVVVCAFDPEQRALRGREAVTELLKNFYGLGARGTGPLLPRRSEVGGFLQAESRDLFHEQTTISQGALFLVLAVLLLYALAMARGVPALRRRTGRRLPLVAVVPISGLAIALLFGFWSVVSESPSRLRALRYELVEASSGPDVQVRELYDLGLLSGDESEAWIEVADDVFSSGRLMRGLEGLLSPFVATTYELRPGAGARVGPIKLFPASFTWLRLERLRRRRRRLSLIASGDGLARIKNLGDAPTGPMALLFQTPAKTAYVAFLDSLAPGEEVRPRLEATLSLAAALEDARRGDGFWELEPAARGRRFMLEAFAGVERCSSTSSLGLDGKRVWLARVESEPWPFPASLDGVEAPAPTGERLVLTPSGGGP